MGSSNSIHIVEKFEILQNIFSNLDGEYKRNKLLTNGRGIILNLHEYFLKL